MWEGLVKESSLDERARPDDGNRQLDRTLWKGRARSTMLLVLAAPVPNLRPGARDGLRTEAGREQ